jgi:L-fucose mutarotase
MLKGIHPCICPDLLKALAEMGHGEEIVFADANFPGHSVSERTIRADGIDVTTLLDAVLPLFELDTYDDPLVMMAAAGDDSLDPAIEELYMTVIDRHAPGTKPPVRIDRFAFYERARSASAIVMSGETRKYGNILLKKGVTPGPFPSVGARHGPAAIGEGQRRGPIHE